jgi:S1-C subfamily serine protease
MMAVRSISLHCLVVCLFLFNSSFAADLPNTIDEIRGSVVAVGTATPIRHSAAKKPFAKYLGTGFVVGNGRMVITNHHVIPEKLDYEKKETLAVFTGRGKSGQIRTAKVVRSDPDHDLALLQISGKPLPAVKLYDGPEIREGTEVAFTGFPLGMALGLYPATHKCIVSVITPIVMPAHFSRNLTAKQIKRLKSPFSVYQLDAIAYPGNSGSPVYEIETGKVIGVVNSVFVKGTKEALLKHPSGISYAIPVRYVRKLLNNR